MLPIVMFMFAGTPSPVVAGVDRNAAAASAGVVGTRDTPATAGSVES